jgi:phosphoglycolate phosphatase-like HAD superfamily hydrolase
MESKIRIGFDMDGVLIDHTESKLVMAKSLGFELTKEQTPSQIMRSVLPKETWERIEPILFYDPQYAFISQIMPGALEVLKSLRKDSIPIFIISRRKKPSVAVEFLKMKGLWPHFFSEKNCSFVTHPHEKNAEAEKFGLTHYIDDEPTVLGSLTNVPNKFLFDQYNTFKDAKNYIRVTTWADFQILFGGL